MGSPVWSETKTGAKGFLRAREKIYDKANLIIIFSIY